MTLAAYVWQVAQQDPLFLRFGGRGIPLGPNSGALSTRSGLRPSQYDGSRGAFSEYGPANDPLPTAPCRIHTPLLVGSGALRAPLRWAGSVPIAAAAEQTLAL
jgi:hypothetical protein